MTAILLVEDDERISDPLVRVLTAEGFEVVHAPDGAAALEVVSSGGADLVLLDLTLPDIDGLEVCRKVRATHPDLPIIMLTARADEVDVIVGLDAGADDYVAKPFRLAELVARIKARLRVAALASPSSVVFEGAGLRVDVAARRAFRRASASDRTGDPSDRTDEHEIELTTKEFDLLALLMSRPGVTFTREQIMNAVWDDNWWGSTRTLDTHISTLRRKIHDDTDPPSIIVTLRGVGFRFEG